MGGYFGWEPITDATAVWHHTALVKSGRSALRIILEVERPSRVYLPYYSCEALAVPMMSTGTPFRFYSINQNWDPVDLPKLLQGELLLYINYNDAKRDTVFQLYKQLGDQLIIDNTQAFFWQPEMPCWAFNSCRKFLGVPDGAYIMSPDTQTLPDMTAWPKNTDIVSTHLEIRNQGRVQEGYPYYRQNEALLDDALQQASDSSSMRLPLLDYETMANRRRNNYMKLGELLGEINQWQHPLPPDSVPMYYPLLPKQLLQREQLWQHQIFVPHFWPDWTDQKQDPSFGSDRQWAAQLLPLPIDQRYGETDMESLADQILSLHG
jgi:hypothetical protein